MSSNPNITQNINEIELDELEVIASDSGALLGENIELVKDVKVNLEVIVGKTEITINELFALEKGDVLSLDKDTRMPLEVRLDGRTVATGSLVAVGSNFGIQINSINKK